MEKQRITTVNKSCRRFLVSFSILLSSLFITLPAFTQSQSQILTAAEIRNLKLSPSEGQNLFAKEDIKFSVIIPKAVPSQVQVISTEQKQDINFRTMRKTDFYSDDYNGTIIEIWYSFEKSGSYTLSPLSVMIQNRRRQIDFDKVEITNDPAKMNARVVIVFDNGTTVFSDSPASASPLFTASMGKKLHFTVNLQYATQLVQFTWDIPKYSIFTQTKEYDFSEIKFRERNYSHELIPVADFEWTALTTGEQALPKFKLAATDYRGYRNELLLPEIIINFIEGSSVVQNQKESDIFSDAFFQQTEFETPSQKITVTYEDCKKLAELYTKEHYAFLNYFSAKKSRSSFESSLNLPPSSLKIFPSILMYISLALILASLILLILAIRKNQKIKLLVFITILVVSMIASIYSLIRRNEKYGICTGCKIYSIPAEKAESAVELTAGSKVRILEKTGKWFFVELGKNGGWCTTDKIIIIK